VKAENIDEAFGIWTSSSLVINANTNKHKDLEDGCHGWCTHQQKIYSSSSALDAQDTQDVNSDSGCDIDATAHPEDSLHVPLRLDNVLKRTLRPVGPEVFLR